MSTSPARVLPVAGRWAAIAASAALVLIALAVPLLVSNPARGVAYTLYGSATQGWGLTSSSISSPGPTLIVTQGDRLDLTLFSADSATHTWCVDYDGDGSCTPGVDDETPSFNSPTTPHMHSITVTHAPGAFTYICGFHLGAIMNGIFRINAPVNPIVSIASPFSGARWTGGSLHPVTWTMTDPNFAVTALTAWVNYSVVGPNGPWNPVAGPIPGSTNPHAVAWTLPVVNATSAAVNVTVVNPTRNRASAVATFVIDSTPPSVAGRIPGNGSTGISTATNVIVAFSEAMNRTATGVPQTAALQDLTTMAWVPLTYSWGPGDQVLTMNPNSNLAPNTMHWVLINASAKDASAPGNPMAAAASWVFTTANRADLEAPQISNVATTPATAEYGTAVDVTATITDNDVVAFAYANVTLPDASHLNHSMAVVSGTTWGWSQSYPQVGVYTFVVDAVDPSGNWNRSARGTFSVRDTTRPAISAVIATPSPAEVYRPTKISATVSDLRLLSVNVVVNGGNSSMTLNGTTGKWERTFTPTQVQTYAFTIWALDRSNNSASASGQLDVRDTTPPPMPTGLVASAVEGSAIQLGWVAVSAPDLAGYKLYRSTSASGPFTSQIGPSPINTTAYLDTGVQPGTTYYYVVTAVDQRGLESMHSSPPASASIPAIPTDSTPVIIGGIAIAIIVAALAVAFILLRRRRRKDA